MQDELTESYKRNSENATAMIELNTQVKELKGTSPLMSRNSQREESPVSGTERTDQPPAERDSQAAGLHLRAGSDGADPKG